MRIKLIYLILVFFNSTVFYVVSLDVQLANYLNTQDTRSLIAALNNGTDINYRLMCYDGMPLLYKAAINRAKAYDNFQQCKNVSALDHYKQIADIYYIILELLILRGADVNNIPLFAPGSAYFENSPLEIAAFHEDFMGCKLLLINGANPNLGRFKPLYWAVYRNNLKLTKLLLDYNAEIIPKHYSLTQNSEIISLLKQYEIERIVKKVWDEKRVINSN